MIHARTRAAGATRSPLLVLAATLAVVLGILAPALAPTGPAAAHDYLIDASPAEGEVLAEPPSEARLVYSGEILTIGAELALVTAGGEYIEFPAPYALSLGTVTQPLPPLDPGEYVLNWRVVSEDGHPVAGSIPFGVADENGVVPASTAEPAEQAGTATSDGETGAGLPPAMTVAVVAIAALAAAAGAVLMIMRLKRGAPGPRWDEDLDDEPDEGPAPER